MAKTMVEILTGIVENLVTKSLEPETELKLIKEYNKMIKEHIALERQANGTDIKETVKSALKAGRTIRQVVADTGASQRMVQEISKECKQVVNEAVNEVVNDTQTECKQDVNEEDDGPDTSHLPLHKEDANWRKQFRRAIEEHEKPKEMPKMIKPNNDEFSAFAQVLKERKAKKETGQLF